MSNNRKRSKRWLTVGRYLYREYTVYNLIFTVLCLDLLIRYAEASYTYIFWLKVVGYVGTGVAYYWSRKKHLHFFHNLGWNIKHLVLASLLIDGTLTMAVLSITNLIFH